jgi:hypothetical protein
MCCAVVCFLENTGEKKGEEGNLQVSRVFVDGGGHCQAIAGCNRCGLDRCSLDRCDLDGLIWMVAVWMVAVWFGSGCHGSAMHCLFVWLDFHIVLGARARAGRGGHLLCSVVVVHLICFVAEGHFTCSVLDYLNFEHTCSGDIACWVTAVL